MSDRDVVCPSAQGFFYAFPFHLVVNESLCIVQLGTSLREVCKEIGIGDLFTQHFEVERPRLSSSIANFHISEKTTYILRYKTSGILFRYQVLSDQGSLMFFVGSPVLSSAAQFGEFGLTLSNFAPHDALPDFLMVMEPKDLYLRDIKNLADSLKESRDALIKTNKILLEKNQELDQSKQTADEKNVQLAQLNKTLKETQAQLIQSEKLASIGGLAAGIAHELNQPLGVISLQAELSLVQLKDGHMQNIDQSLHQILNQVERATKIIDHLRIFGRDAWDVPKEPCDLTQLIADSLTLFREPFRLNNITLVEDLEKDVPPIKCNVIQLEQVITNLLSNAKDAVECSKEKLIVIRARRVADSVVIEVEDSGSGIPSKVQEKIFDPFYTTKEVGKGTGLGLSICYSIIKDHKGTLNVDSTIGKGARFVLTLPLFIEKGKANSLS